MKTIRTHLLARPLACFLAFMVLFISCSAPEGNAPIVNDNELQSMSGEQLFRSVLFKEGDFGSQLYNQDEIEIMNKLDPELALQLEIVKTEIIAGINGTNPGYFDTFKSAILSNDHNLMLTTLLDARNMVKETIKAQNDLTDRDIKDYDQNALKEQFMNRALPDEEACVAILIIALILFIAFIPLIEDTPTSMLENEEIVGNIISINQ